ncbi:MAG: hypothetical protein AB8B99_03325 [Phormidesmis sp.]
MLDTVQPRVHRLKEQDSLPTVLASLDIALGCPTLVVVGGASKLDEVAFFRVRSLFSDVLVPLAVEHNLTVVDGGTDAGIMKMMGEARSAAQQTFPLVGVAPSALVSLPTEPSVHPDATMLEEHHTHCLLIEGDEWGDESPWMARVASEISQDKPSIAVLINGGQVTWTDARCNVEVGRRVVVVSGSGRTADILAIALQGDRHDEAGCSDERAKFLVESGLLSVVDLNASSEVLKRSLSALLFS